MLILLPPSEGKRAPVRGRPLDLEQLSFPGLTPTRTRVLGLLVDLCRDDPERARIALGLSAGQLDEVGRNAGLLTAPTATAGRIYSGVVYDGLNLAGRSTPAKRRATTRVAVASALFGLVRLGDRIPSYRLSAGGDLPGIGTLASTWREPLGEVISAEAKRGLVVDLRSESYAAFWRPPASSGVVTVRVLREADGVRSVLSHFNKHTKGRIVADLLEDGANPTSRSGLERALARLGWYAEPATSDPRGLDVIVPAP